MKLIVCVILLFALPDHSRAIGKCTGVFQESDASTRANGKLRPPSGTKCVEDCILQSGRWGSSWCYTAKDKSQWGGECLDCSIFPENTSPCWSLKNGYYVTNGHGQTDECYETFTEAKLRCIAAGDCKAIATQSNICSGKFRVTHGIPAFRWWSHWKSLNLKTYEYTCRTVAVPEFHDVLEKSPNMAKYLYENQIQLESKVSDGVIYTRMHRGGMVETGFAEVLQETLKKYDLRFSQGVSAYWTFQIRIARKNKGSKFHSYAKSLPTGIQTIKRRLPTSWMGGSGDMVFTWSDVAEKKVIVY